MFCSCRISTDKCVARSLCHSRASCLSSLRLQFIMVIANGPNTHTHLSALRVGSYRPMSGAKTDVGHTVCRSFVSTPETTVADTSGPVGPCPVYTARQPSRVFSERENIFTSPPGGVRSIAICLSVCLSGCITLKNHTADLQQIFYPRC